MSRSAVKRNAFWWAIIAMITCGAMMMGQVHRVAAVAYAVATDLDFSYNAYIEGSKWGKYKAGGTVLGTEGQSRRLEGFNIKLATDSGIEYRSHVQDYGWMKYVSGGSRSGAGGEGKRLEAVQIRLKGNIAKLYDVYYRVHVQDIGWM